MSDDEKKVAISLPGEWMLQKTFGPVLSEIGVDLKKVYEKGRDRLLAVAYRKVRDHEDGKKANLRVTQNVLWNGAFTEAEICAEYFGGILASSRSDDGKNDDAIHYVDTIKSLSAKQLHLHYLIYNCLNKLLVSAGRPVNVGQSAELQRNELWLAMEEIQITLSLSPDSDLSILLRQDLIGRWKVDNQALGPDRTFAFGMVAPTTFGVLLYASAQNRLADWRKFDGTDFGDFPNVALPKVFGDSLANLLKSVDVSGLYAPPP